MKCSKKTKIAAIVAAVGLLAALIIVLIVRANIHKNNTTVNEKTSQQQIKKTDSSEVEEDQKSILDGLNNTVNNRKDISDDNTGNESENDDGEFISDVPSIDKGAITNIEASSSLTEDGVTHSPDRVCDGSLKKAWVEGADGQGIDEYIYFEFDDEYKIKSIDINAGYQKSKALYNKNSRPKKIRISFSDGSSECKVLKDVYGKQKITFSDDIVTDSIKLEILSVYEGSKYDDTVISEIDFK